MAFGQWQGGHLQRSQQHKVVDEEFSLPFVRILGVFRLRDAFHPIREKLGEYFVLARRYIQSHVKRAPFVLVGLHLEGLQLVSIQGDGQDARSRHGRWGFHPPLAGICGL